MASPFPTLGDPVALSDEPSGVTDDLASDTPDALEAFVTSVQHLPLFTGMAAQLIRSVDDDDVGAPELAKMISADAALVAHLLRIVNSSYYGLNRRIGTVTEACAVLGLDLIRRTVTVAVLQRPLFAYLHDTVVARDFWRHELLCAALSRHLAQRRGLNGEQAYLAGVLHDVGRLVMLMSFPDQIDLLLRRSSDDDDGGLQRELDQFGFTHAQVGGALLELWGLPEGIVQAAHQHTDETEPEDGLAAVVWRANLISHDFGNDADDGVERPWLEPIGLDEDGRRRILDEIDSLGST